MNYIGEVNFLMHIGADFNYFDVVAAARKNYSKLLDPICKQWNLTRNELDILLFLHNNPEYDRAADIVSRRGITKSHVSMGVASLEEKGFLKRCYDENDRRTAHLKPENQGERIAAQARDMQMQYFSALYQGISREEFEIWRKITQKVCANIEHFDSTL